MMGGNPRPPGAAARMVHELQEVHMGIESLLIFLLVGAIAGWLAGQIVKGYGFGLVGNIVVGIVGAFIAGLLLPRLNLGVPEGIVGSIIYATIGAVVLLLLIRMIKRA
jgi:uncharacterized membrane protein YeaQ/YmgE (transglycosylase-associated protein family)